MTRDEYERIQEVLSARIHAGSRAGGIEAAKKEGILLAKTALGEWYHDHAQDEPKPVQHGRWLPPVVGKYGCLCSACNKQADNAYDYCPNCGAKMESEV